MAFFGSNSFFRGGMPQRGTRAERQQFMRETGMKASTTRSFSGSEGYGGLETQQNPAFSLWRSMRRQMPVAAPQQAAPTGFQPGDDPNTQAGAQARQDAAADELDGMSDPVVAGRREALAGRRQRGVGLAPLNRGFAAGQLLV